MSVEKCYQLLHGNYEDAISRLMNDQLITRFLVKFTKDETMKELLTAIEDNDHEKAFLMVHTLKGVAANMAFTQLQIAASELTEQLRNSTEPADPVLLENVRISYQLVIDTINQFNAENN